MAGHLALGFGVAASIAAEFRLRREPVRAVPRARWWKAGFCGLLGLELDVRGEPAEGPVLLVANHVSWLDILAVGAVRPVNFVSKAEIAGWPVAGWMVRQGGTLFLPRGAGQAGEIARGITERLSAGGAVLVFPEGTTSDGAQVRPFFPRLFAPVAGQPVAVQPVAIRYRATTPTHPTAPFVGDDTFGGHLVRVLGERRIEAELTFQPPIEGSAFDRKGLAQACQRAICEALGLPFAQGRDDESAAARRRAFARRSDDEPEKPWR